MEHIIVNGEDALIKLLEQVSEGPRSTAALSEILVVTLARPNGMGHYHPGYLVAWPSVKP